MSTELSELLADFAGALTSATFAPDEYPTFGYVNYESNMADLRDLWSRIKPQLSRAEHVEFIDSKLAELFGAFAAGEKSRGRAAVMAIYNLDVKRLK